MTKRKSPTGKKKPGPKKGSGGRPKKPPATIYTQFENFGREGIRRNKLARILDWSEDTLSRRLEDDPELLRALERGEAEGEVSIGQRLFDLALGIIAANKKTGKPVLVQGRRAYLVGPNLGALIWIEKTRYGRTDKISVEGLPDPNATLADGRTPMIPLTTLRAAVRAAEATKKNVLRFPQRKDTA